jgi:CheY-like chemotaxis protein
MPHFPILCVEDNEDDILLLGFAVKRADILNPLYFARDGQEAVNYLAGAQKFSDRMRYPIPGLVLLDLKLPKKMGMEVLQWIRQERAKVRCGAMLRAGSQRILSQTVRRRKPR